MERRELHHDRHTVSLLTDHIVVSPKYRGKIPVEKTIALAVEGIIRKIYKEMKIEIIGIAVKNQEKTNAKTLCSGL
jgi:REP element-mobilizing transposase RayT